MTFLKKSACLEGSLRSYRADPVESAAEHGHTPRGKQQAQRPTSEDKQEALDQQLPDEPETTRA